MSKPWEEIQLLQLAIADPPVAERGRVERQDPSVIKESRNSSLKNQQFFYSFFFTERKQKENENERQRRRVNERMTTRTKEGGTKSNEKERETKKENERTKDNENERQRKKANKEERKKERVIRAYSLGTYNAFERSQLHDRR